MRANVKPSETTYIAVDGVAPMAKLRQQRFRRFRSAALARLEAETIAHAQGKPYIQEERWDTNAITPGTTFMSKLTTALQNYAKTHTGVVVSSSDVPGEGEQKLMAYIREKRPASALVYGLDADLIVLSLMTAATHNVPIDLYREETEVSGGVKTGTDGELKYLYLDLAKLAEALYARYSSPEQSRTMFLCEFAAAVNLLGNDFVPHSLSVKIRDDGIPILMDLYSQLAETLLIYSEDGQPVAYNKTGLHELLRKWASMEPGLLQKNFSKKLEARSFGGRTPVEAAMNHLNDAPVRWAVETPLLQTVSFEGKSTHMLKHDWSKYYDTLALNGATAEQAVQRWFQAVTWNLAYYVGSSVSTTAFYPYYNPPRMASIVEWLSKNELPDYEAKGTLTITPIVQLASVLPQTSFDLLPPHVKNLPKAHPFAWPTEWGYNSFGRRFFWECEPYIPIVGVEKVAGWLEDLEEEPVA